MAENNTKKLQTLLNGEWLTHDFIKRQGKLVLLILAWVIVYIHSSYRSKQQFIEMDRLEQEIADTRYTYLQLSSDLNQLTRQSIMEQKLREQGSNIHTSLTPAIEIK